MSRDTECDRIRLRLMASADGEAAEAAPDRQHVSACPSCRTWLEDLESLTGRLQSVSYPPARVDLWPGVAGRIGQPDRSRALTFRLLAISAVVVGWRALQLSMDVPVPLLHPIVPLAAAVVAVWQIAGDPLAIVTFAPELQKRGA